MQITTKNKLKMMIDKWKTVNNTKTPADINRLADETLQIINSDPFVKDICEMFMYSVSIKSMADRDFASFVNSYVNRQNNVGIAK